MLQALAHLLGGLLAGKMEQSSVGLSKLGTMIRLRVIEVARKPRRMHNPLKHAARVVALTCLADHEHQLVVLRHRNYLVAVIVAVKEAEVACIG